MEKYGAYEDIEYFFIDSRRNQIRSIHDALEQMDKLDTLYDHRVEK